MATQFNAEDKTELRAAASSVTTLTNWATGGGLQSDVGNAVLNSGIPKGPGGASATNPRVALWSVIRDIYQRIEDLHTKLDNMGTLPSADIAYIKSAVDQLIEDPATSGHDNPIVAAVEWADAN